MDPYSEAIEETGPPPNFQIMVANGQLEDPIGTVLLELEVADLMLKENFIFMKNLPNQLIGLCFLSKNNAIFDVTQGILFFPYPSMHPKPDTQTAIRQATPLLAENTYTLQPGETIAIASETPHLMDHDATGIVAITTTWKPLSHFLSQLRLVPLITMLSDTKSSTFPNYHTQ